MSHLKSGGHEDPDQKRMSMEQQPKFDESMGSLQDKSVEYMAAKSSSLQRSVLTNRGSNRNQSKKQIKQANSFTASGSAVG